MRRRLRQILRVVSTGLAFAGFFAGGAALGWIVLPLVALLSPSEEEGARRCRRVVRRSWILFHDVLRICGVLDFDPRRVRVTLPAGPCLVVANHPSLLDVTAIATALPDLTLVAKSSMYRAPVLGRLLRLCGYVEAGGDTPFAGAETAARCVDALRRGVPVLIFPEGTRSPERGLGPFRPGAFEIAERAGAPVVPLVLRMQPPTLLRGQAWYTVPPVTPRLTIEPLAGPSPGSAPAPVLADLLRERYARQLG